MKRPDGRVSDFPPDIFWIRPDGFVYNVIGHLTGIKGKPEKYGLHSAPEGKAEEERALDGLFREGWVRGRFSDGTFSFQMERPRGTPMGNAHKLVLEFADQAKEVAVDFWDPSYAKLAKTIPAHEFVNQKFPSRWGLGRTDNVS